MARFIGRAHELGVLDAACRDLEAGRGSAFLLCGPPGIGKTRLAREVCVRASGRGVRVAWATVWQGGTAPEQWPWRQLLHELGAAAEDGDVVDRLWRSVVGATRDGSLLVVVDDLQWADPSTVEVFTLLARAAPPRPLLVIGTHRQPRAAELDSGAIAVISLKPLTVDEVAALAQELTGRRMPTRRAEVVAALTGGNPFLVAELLRDPQGQATTVAAMVQSRLEQLAGPDRELLASAAVLPSGLSDAAVVADVLGVSEDLRCRLVAAASGVGLLAPDGSFPHELLRSALLQTLDGARLRALHRTAAEAATRRGAHATAALHLEASGDRVAAAAAHRHAAAASHRAGAYSDAFRHLREARRCGDDTAATVLSYSVAALRCGRYREALAGCREVLRVGRSAAAAILFEDARLAAGDLHAVGESLAYLRAARPAATDPRTEVRLDTRIAQCLQYAGDPDRSGVRLARAALVAARHLDDPGLEIEATGVLAQSLLDPDTLEECLRTSTELMRRSDAEQGWWRLAQVCRWQALAVLGRERALEVEQLELEGRLRAHPDRWTAFWTAAVQAPSLLARGRWGEATELASRLRELADDWHVGALADGLAVIEAVAAWEQGRSQDAAAGFDAIAAASPPLAPALRALTAALRGERSSAPLAAAVPAGTVQTLNGAWRLPQLTVLALAATEAGDATAAAAVHRELQRIPPHLVVLLLPVRLYTVGFWLGCLAATMGRWHAAIRHLRAALDQHRRMGATAWVARTRAVLGRALVASGRTAEGDALLARAAEELAALGMAAVADRSVDRPVFRRTTDGWSVRFGAEEVRLPDRKGLSYLAELVRRAGEPVHVLQLAFGSDPSGPRPAGRQELLDGQARRQLQAHAERLRGMVADADADGRPAVAASEELRAVVHTIAQADGSYGRTRVFGDDVERARVNVTRAIGRAIAALERVHPALGQHLRDRVRTGQTCIYLPRVPTVPVG